MSASALTSVNGSSARIAHIVAYGSTVTLSLVSTNDVRTCTFKILSDSHGSVSFPDITDVILGSATFTMPADPSTGAGWGFLCQTIVNENTSTQNISTFIVGATSTAAIVPIPPGETTERNAQLGWLEVLNQLLGATSSGIGDLGNENVIIGGPSGNQIRHLLGSDVPTASGTGSGVVPSLAGLDGPAILGTQDDSSVTWVGAGLSNYLVLTIDGTGHIAWAYLNANHFDLSVDDHTVMLTVDGNSTSFAKVSNAYISDVAWSKITGIPTASDSSAGILPASPAANRVPISVASGNVIWGAITDSQISALASVDVSKLAAGTSGRVLTTNGSTNAWAALSGDVSGAYNALAVTKINGATVPASPDSGKAGWLFAVAASGAYGLYPASGLGIPTVSGTPTAGQFIVWNGSEFVYTPIAVTTTLPLTGGGGFNPTLGINEVSNTTRGAVPPVPTAFSGVLASNMTASYWVNAESLSVQWIGDVKVTNSPTVVGQVLTYTGLDGSSNKTAAWQ